MLSLRRLHHAGDRWSVGACPARNSTRARARSVRAAPWAQSSMCPSAYSAPTRRRVRINARYPRGYGDTPGGILPVQGSLARPSCRPGLPSAVHCPLLRGPAAYSHSSSYSCPSSWTLSRDENRPISSPLSSRSGLARHMQAAKRGKIRGQNWQRVGGATLDDSPGSCCQRVWCW